MKELIDKIIGNFNFKKVHQTMTELNWRWATTSGVPTVGELVTRAQELLYDVSKMDVGWSIGAGGFRATKIKDSDEGEGLLLEFVLTETNYYIKWLN